MSADLGASPPPLSARSALENALYEDAKYPPDVLHHLIDAFAHELAEKQRRLAAPAGMLRSERMQGFAAGALAAAALIDPEAPKDAPSET